MALEFKSDAKLSVPWGIGTGSYRAKRAAIHAGIGKCKSYGVREIKELAADLYFHAFTNGEFFTQRKICIVDPIAP